MSLDETRFAFYVCGAFCKQKDQDPDADPDSWSWEPFTNQDLHPSGSDFFVMPVPVKVAGAKGQALQEVATVIDWLRKDRGWVGFDATLYLFRSGLQRDTVMKKWMLV